MTIGVAGIVVSLLFIPAIWVGRGAAIGYAADAADQVTASLQQVQDTTAQFHADVDSFRAPLEQVVGETDSMATTGPLEQQASTRLLGVIDQTIGPAYARVRETYVNVREKVAGAAQAAANLQRLVPGLSLPTPPTEEIVALDSQLQAMDAGLREARDDLVAGALPSAVPGVDTLRKVDDGLRTVDARLNTLATTADDISTRAQEMQVAVRQGEGYFENAMSVLAIILTLLCADLASLNAGLFVYGRELRRSSAPAPIAVAAAPPVTSELIPAAAPGGVGS
jgi:hypothetical protein